jgi:hypothetical protein
MSHTSPIKAGPPVIRQKCSCLLKKIDELGDSQARLVDDIPQRALGQFAMIRHCQPAVRWLLMAKNDVASGLVVDLVPQPPQGSDRFPAGDDRQLAQTVTSIVSSVMAGGIGSLCFARLAR